MTNDRPQVDLGQGYARAAGYTGARLAAAPRGFALNGFWLDTHRYLFVAEDLDAAGDVRGRRYVADGAEGRIEPAPGIEVGAPLEVSPITLVAPDGRHACIVQDHNLWLIDQATGEHRALTRDGRAHRRYAHEPDSALSALTVRKHPIPAALWSADSAWLLTHRIDEQTLPDLTLVEHAPPAGGRPRAHCFKYPLPGDPIGEAIYVAIHIASGRTVTFEDLPFPISGASPFTDRHAWFGGTDTAWGLRFDRFGRRVDLIAFDLGRGDARVVLSEASATGPLDLHPLATRAPNVRCLAETSEIIWFSEADGWGHLYLHDARTGELKNRITGGAWQVRDIVEVDEHARTILFLAGGLDPVEDRARRTLCAVGFDGSGFEQLRCFDGDVSAAGIGDVASAVTAGCGRARRSPVSPDGRFCVVHIGSAADGNSSRIVDLRSGNDLTLTSVGPNAGDVTPRRFTVRAADEATDLHGLMFLPSAFDERARYPLVVSIYPGPHIAHQPQHFRALKAAPAMAIAELGFVTVMLDTRGTPFGDTRFRRAADGALVEPQLADHRAAVEQLCHRYAFIDGERVGVFGQSAGGAAVVRALCAHGDLFKAGVACCGCYDPRTYAASWADKYCGEGAAETLVDSATIEQLRGRLLLISGDLDENVPVSQTISLSDILIRANKDFDLIIVPNAGHDVMIHPYAQRRTWDFFVRHLRGETPPSDVRLDADAAAQKRFNTVRQREAGW